MHKENQEYKQIIPLSIVLLSNTKEAKRKQLIKENPKSEAPNGFNLTLCHHYRFKHIRYDVNQQWFPPRQWLLVRLYEDPLKQAILSSPVDTPVSSHKTCSLHKNHLFNATSCIISATSFEGLHSIFFCSSLYNNYYIGRDISFTFIFSFSSDIQS